MIKVKKNFIYASLIGILLTGCATYSQEDCELIRWDEQGYNDALKAYSSSELNEYVHDCSKYVFVDVEAYNKGRAAGAEEYCTIDNGYDYGLAGHTLTDVCNGASGKNNYMEGYSRGLTVYKANAQLLKIDSKLSEIDQYINDKAAFSVRREILANRDYLYNLRYTVEEYVTHINQIGPQYNEPMEQIDYSSYISKEPYPHIVPNVKRLIKLQEGLVKLDRKIFDKEKELSTYSKKSKTTDRIYREIDCLKKQRRIYKKELVILANEARYHNISETIRVDSCHVY